MTAVKPRCPRVWARNLRIPQASCEGHLRVIRVSFENPSSVERSIGGMEWSISGSRPGHGGAPGSLPEPCGLPPGAYPGRAATPRSLPAPCRLPRGLRELCRLHRSLRELCRRHRGLPPCRREGRDHSIIEPFPMWRRAKARVANISPSPPHGGRIDSTRWKVDRRPSEPPLDAGVSPVRVRRIVVTVALAATRPDRHPTGSSPTDRPPGGWVKPNSIIDN